ncbi:MAG: hypothetical protein J6I53_03650 [Treponema sp.]|nr:hypothetical protein [Treponema sp.]
MTRKQDSDLAQGISLISETINSKGMDELAFLELPYYITYAVWEQESGMVISTNDSLLPLLESEKPHVF